MPHNADKRREAAAVPLVLFGDYGRTVEGYRPADEDLAAAAPGQARHHWVPVVGPHLRCARGRDRRSQTGVVGISFSHIVRGHRSHTYYVVNLGSTCRRFCIETLGRSEALRRAMALRREHVKKLAQANAVILTARAANCGAETATIGGAS